MAATARKPKRAGWSDERRAKFAATWAKKHATQAAAIEKRARADAAEELDDGGTMIPLEMIQQITRQITAPLPAKRVPARAKVKDQQVAACGSSYQGVSVAFSRSKRALVLLVDNTQLPFTIID